MAILLARRYNIGPVLMIAAATLLLTTSRPLQLTPTLLTSIIGDPNYYWILAIVVGVSLLGTILKHLNKIPLLVSSLETIVGKRSFVLPLLPMVIGALPMPGGAYLSAPMVEQAAADTNLSPEKRTVSNHWFRHLLEFVFPLYPGFLLSAKLCSIDIRTFLYYTYPMAIVGWLAAYIILLSREELGTIDLKTEKPWFVFASAVWPVVSVVVLTLLIPRSWFGDPFIVALFISILVLSLRHRLFSWKQWAPWLKQAFSRKLIVMVTGTFVFKHALEITGLTKTLAPELANSGIPLSYVLGLVPFAIGLLVGYAVGFAGICYPVLLPLITTSGIVDAKLAAWIYIAGWAGMMLSPAHLCLVLTQEYFNSKWLHVYAYLSILSFIIALTGFFLTFLG